MKQEHSEAQRKYDDALMAMRTAQTRFEMLRSDVVAAHERRNRLQISLSDAESAASEAKARWDSAFRKADGVLSPELRALRSTLREAQDMAEDYRNLVSEAEAGLMHEEVPALEAARDVDTHRRRAMNLAAEIALSKMAAACAPEMARALSLLNAANTSDNPAEIAHTHAVDPASRVISALTHALTEIAPYSLELPDDLKRTSIAPLRWEDANSTIGLLRRKAAAKNAEGAK